MYWSRSIWTLSSLSADLWNSLSMRLSLFWYSKHSSFSLPRSSVLPLQLRVSVRLFLVSPYLYYILQTKLSPGRKLWHSTAYIFCALISWRQPTFIVWCLLSCIFCQIFCLRWKDISSPYSPSLRTSKVLVWVYPNTESDISRTQGEKTGFARDLRIWEALI